MSLGGMLTYLRGPLRDGVDFLERALALDVVRERRSDS